MAAGKNDRFRINITSIGSYPDTIIGWHCIISIDDPICKNMCILELCDLYLAAQFSLCGVHWQISIPYFYLMSSAYFCLFSQVWNSLVLFTVHSFHDIYNFFFTSKIDATRNQLDKSLILWTYWLFFGPLFRKLYVLIDIRQDHDLA